MARGTVKWWNPDKGYGFITAEDGEDHFAHFSEIQMEGFKNLTEGQTVWFDITFGQSGKTQATSIKITESQEAEKPSDEEPQAAEWIGVALVDGRFRLIAVSPDGPPVLLDEWTGPSTLLLTNAERLALIDAIDELESLMDQGAPESAYQDFFERHSKFLVPDDYVRAIPQVTLVADTGKALRPDFMLQPHNQQRFADVLELKLPHESVVVGPPGRERFSAAVQKACAQLREYRDFFDNPEHRMWFEKHNSPLRAFRPAMWLVVGRRGEYDPLAFRRLECEAPMLHLRTYDDLVERVRSRLSL